MWASYFGIERCELTGKVIESVFDEFKHAVPAWRDMVRNSFLSEEMKIKYRNLMDSRLRRLGLG